MIWGDDIGDDNGIGDDMRGWQWQDEVLIWDRVDIFLKMAPTANAVGVKIPPPAGFEPTISVLQVQHRRHWTSEATKVLDD